MYRSYRKYRAVDALYASSKTRRLPYISHPCLSLTCCLSQVQFLAKEPHCIFASHGQGYTMIFREMQLLAPADAHFVEVKFWSSFHYGHSE